MAVGCLTNPELINTLIRWQDEIDTVFPTVRPEPASVWPPSMAKHPTLTAYVQTDPRGCALYLLTAEHMQDVYNGRYTIDSVYTRGIAIV